MRCGVDGSGSGSLDRGEERSKYATSRGGGLGADPAVAATTPALAMSSIGRSSAAKSSQAAGLLRAVNELGEPAESLVALGLSLAGARERLGQNVGEAAILGLHRTHTART